MNDPVHRSKSSCMPRHLISGDAAIRAVKAGNSRARLTDGDGLYLKLFVKGGSHGWRIDYSFAGKRNTLSLGTYPDVGLAAARRKAEEVRGLVADGQDPSGARKSEKSEPMPSNYAFEAICCRTCAMLQTTDR